MSDFALNRTDQLLAPRVARIRIHRRGPVVHARAPRAPRATRPRRSRSTTVATRSSRVVDLEVRSVFLWPRSYR